MKKVHRIRICFVCSAGGHFEELKQLRKVIDRYDDHFWVLTKNKSTKDFVGEKILLNDYNRRNILTKFFSMIRICISSFVILLIKRPNVIISTGAAIAIPFFKISQLFKIKTIYIESFARIFELSKTGGMLIHISNLFIVQWQQLEKKYTGKVVYGGQLL